MSRLKKKAAVELSMNFLVILIITLVIFGFGIAFTYKFRDRSSDILNLKFDELNQRVEDLLCSSSEKSCIGVGKLTIRRGENGLFSLKVINMLDSGEDLFTLTVASSTPSGYDKDNNDINTPLQFVPTNKEFNVKINNEKKLGIAVFVPKDAKSGTYILEPIIHHTPNIKSTLKFLRFRDYKETS